MSLNTALGRYFQLAVNQRKEHTVAELLCAHRRCLLASVVVFDWQGHPRRAVLVQAHTNALLTKNGQPEGVNATAPRDFYPGLTTELLEGMKPGEVLDLLYAGQLKEAHLEHLYRASGGNLARIAYIATADDFTGRTDLNRFTRCDHISGYLPPNSYNTTKRRTLLTQADLTR